MGKGPNDFYISHQFSNFSVEVGITSAWRSGLGGETRSRDFHITKGKVMLALCVHVHICIDIKNILYIHTDIFAFDTRKYQQNPGFLLWIERVSGGIMKNFSPNNWAYRYMVGIGHLYGQIYIRL